jgi:hypothetical protein
MTDGESERDRRAHARIEAALRDVGADLAPPAGWQQRVLAAGAASAPAPAPARGRWWWIAAPAVLAAAAVIAVVVWPRPDAPAAPRLAVDVQHGPNTMRGSSAVLGDVLVARGAGGDRERALWVFHAGTLVAACPGDARCAADAGGWRLELALDKLGPYRIVYLSAPGSIAAPTDGYDRAVSAARDAGATAKISTLEVL